MISDHKKIRRHTACVMNLETDEGSKCVHSSGSCFKRTRRLKQTQKLISSYLLCFQMDLMPFVNKAGCECLNESDDCGFDNCLIKDSTYLESDCDEQVRGLNSNNLPPSPHPLSPCSNSCQALCSRTTHMKFTKGGRFAT